MIARPQAWADYWRDPRAIASLGETDAETRKTMAAVWHDFAKGLPARAALLDLATGNGIVLTTIRAVRKDVKLTGVDSAPALPKPPAGIRFVAGATIEALPFADAAFDAVTSRFGIEYGDPNLAAREAARVLRASGRLRLMIHHADSLVLRHNLPRLAALIWAVRDSGWLGQAENLARARRVAALPTTPQLRTAPADAQRLHPGQQGAWEFATALVQTLDMGMARGPDWTLGTLTALREKGESEIARLEALRDAACDSNAIERLQAALGTAGVTGVTVRVLRAPGATAPLAWVLDGTKSGSATR